jgi:tetraacyldisaccharide 4'-kinase
LESAVLGLWYGPPWRVWPLLPLSAFYAFAVAVRAAPYRFGWRHPVRLPVPVVVVGNITVGGTGKTPLVIHLAQRLAAVGERPGILCRGYGGTSAHWPQQVTPGSDPREVGDEPVLIARRSGLPVAAGPDRVAAGRLLITQGCTVLLCDDGLQHRALARDIEIVVMDGARGLGNGFCLPAGPLRESTRRLGKVDAVVVQGGEWSGGRSTFAMDLPLGDTVVAVTDDGRRSLAEFVGQTVHAMAGIGHPQRFFGALRQAGLRVVEHPFPDHYDYRPEDLRFAADGVLLMTEKDAVKCARFPLRNAWFVPVSAQVDPELEAKVLTWVRQRGRDLRQG